MKIAQCSNSAVRSSNAQRTIHSRSRRSKGQAPALRNVVGDEAAMLRPESHRVRALCIEGNNGLRTLATFIRSLPRRRWSEAESEALDRTHRQRKGLRAGKRPVGDVVRADAQHASQSPHRVQRTNTVSPSVGGRDRDRGVSYPLQAQALGRRASTHNAGSEVSS